MILLLFVCHLENQGDHIHAFRGDFSWRAEAWAAGSSGQTHACHNDHHERPYVQQMPKRTAAGGGKTGKSHSDLSLLDLHVLQLLARYKIMIKYVVNQVSAHKST